MQQNQFNDGKRTTLSEENIQEARDKILNNDGKLVFATCKNGDCQTNDEKSDDSTFWPSDLDFQYETMFHKGSLYFTPTEANKINTALKNKGYYQHTTLFGAVTNIVGLKKGASENLYVIAHTENPTSLENYLAENPDLHKKTENKETPRHHPDQPSEKEQKVVSPTSSSISPPISPPGRKEIEQWKLNMLAKAAKNGDLGNIKFLDPFSCDELMFRKTAIRLTPEEAKNMEEIITAMGYYSYKTQKTGENEDSTLNIVAFKFMGESKNSGKSSYMVAYTTDNEILQKWVAGYKLHIAQKDKNIDSPKLSSPNTQNKQKDKTDEKETLATGNAATPTSWFSSIWQSTSSFFNLSTQSLGAWAEQQEKQAIINNLKEIFNQNLLSNTEKLNTTLLKQSIEKLTPDSTWKEISSAETLLKNACAVVIPNQFSQTPRYSSNFYPNNTASSVAQSSNLSLPYTVRPQLGT